MKNIPLFLIIILCAPFLLLAQNGSNSAETIQFPTIKNDETIDLDNPLPQKCIKNDSNTHTQQSRKFPITTSESTSFYTDIIIGGVVLLLGFITWFLYQKFSPQSEES